MKRYYNIDFLAMREFNLSEVEWRICENTDFLCNDKPNDFYSDKTRAELGDFFGLSEDRMKRIIRSLIIRGFLKQNKRHHLRVGKRWLEVQALNGKPISKNKIETATKEALEEATSEEPTVERLSAVHFEEVFGEDEVSSVKDAPSRNEVRAVAVEITSTRGTKKELAVKMADSFWDKQEGMAWRKVVNFKPWLRRFIDFWERNDRESVGSIKNKEPKITTPINTHEMSLWLKQLSDEDRAKILFKDSSGYPIVINHIGLPVFKEGGEYCSKEYTDKVLNHFLSDFQNTKKRYKS